MLRSKPLNQAIGAMKEEKKETSAQIESQVREHSSNPSLRFVKRTFLTGTN